MTVSGTAARREQCVHCSTTYEYNIRRNGMGNGHSPFRLNNVGAKQTAERRARKALEIALEDAVEPVHCPRCGMYQPEMLQELSRRFGVRFDPNGYAEQRVTVPFHVLWDETNLANTVEAFEYFKRVWPIYADQVNVRLRELRHPIRRKALRVLAWGFWIVLAGGFGVLALLSILGDRIILR